MEKNSLKVKNFHCSEHGYIKPEPHCPKCEKNTPERTHPSDWEKEFDERFRMEDAAREGKGVGHGLGAEVKRFIRETIRHREEEIVQMIEGMKKYVPEDYSPGAPNYISYPEGDYNQALNDLKAKLAANRE